MSLKKSITRSQPLVSVVTPVHNGEKYLQECIESVLSQSYKNLEYIIVNNYSSDRSLKIALEYEKKDPRIRVHDNNEYLSMIDNFNNALAKISPESKYCKVIHADDFLFPDCIAKMVNLSEKNPSIGIVSSYVLEGVRVKCDGLPYPSHLTSGRDICKWTLIDRSPQNGGLYVFGSPTTLLIRSELIRNRKPFYQDKYLQVVDQEVCYHLLKNSDFGFVHEVLSFSRLHENSITSSVTSLNRLILEELMIFIEYGPFYLDKAEYQRYLAERIDQYYIFLAKSFFKKKDNNFWKLHIDGMKKINIRLNKAKILTIALKELILKFLIACAHPLRTVRSFMVT